MSDFMRTIFRSLCVAGFAVTAMPAFSDDSVLKGGMRFYGIAPSVEAQNATCESALNRGLGVFMTFVGVEPWVTNHPLLERNCATLLDILPVAELPFRQDLIRKGSLWTRVVRVRFPDNVFGLGEGYGFGWCASASCKTNMLLAFNDQAIVGFCLRSSGGTTYFLSNGGARGFTGRTERAESCIEPQEAIARIFSLDSWGTPIKVAQTDFAPSVGASDPRYFWRYGAAPAGEVPSASPPPVSSFYGSCHGGAFYGC